MKDKKYVKGFEEFNENLNISDDMNSYEKEQEYIMKISNDFKSVADKYNLIQVDDTLDYEGEFAEDFSGSIYSVNIWIKDENLPLKQRKFENRRIVIGVMFDESENIIDIEDYCNKLLSNFDIESMKFTDPEEFTKIKTFEIVLKYNIRKL